MVSADRGLHQTLLPAITLTEHLLKGQFKERNMHEDNEVAEDTLKNGRSKTMETVLSRTHDIAVKATTETLEREKVGVLRASSDEMKADIFTKPFTSAQKWLQSLRHVQIGKTISDTSLAD